jgi:hypothetical protein
MRLWDRLRLGSLHRWTTAPLWCRLAEGCHPNRDTVGTLRAAGFAVEEIVAYLGGLVPGIRARAPEAP